MTESGKTLSSMSIENKLSKAASVMVEDNEGYALTLLGSAFQRGINAYNGGNFESLEDFIHSDATERHSPFPTSEGLVAGFLGYIARQHEVETGGSDV